MSGPPSDLVIRLMTPADIPQVIEIASALHHAPHYPHGAWVAILDPESRPAHLALVASLPSGQIHGFALASLFPPQAELEAIAVPTASQRTGIARQLLRFLLKSLHAAAIQQLWLEVRPSNIPAISLYQSLGFSLSGTRPRYYADPVEDGLLMDLQIH